MTRPLALALALLLAITPLPGRAQSGPPVAAQVVPGFSGGGISSAVANVKGDLHGGGIVAKLLGTLISGGVKGTEMGVGPTAGVISAAKNIFDPAFVFGNLPGGLLGGALGAAIPLPTILGRMGLAGEMLKFAPSLLGAVFGSSALMQAWDLHRDGKLTVDNLLQRMDVPSLLAVSAGVDVMVVLSRVFIPPLRVGPVNLTEVGAALAGGWIATKLLNAVRSKQAAARASSTLATGLNGSSVPVITGPKPATESAARADEAYRAYVAAEQRGDATAAKVAHQDYLRLTQPTPAP